MLCSLHSVSKTLPQSISLKSHQNTNTHAITIRLTNNRYRFLSYYLRNAFTVYQYFNIYLWYESQNRPQLLGAGLKLAARPQFKVGLKRCGGSHPEFVIFSLACCGQTLNWMLITVGPKDSLIDSDYNGYSKNNFVLPEQYKSIG